MKKTSLYDFHQRNSKLVEFAGFEMPIWYTSIIDEHLAVRNHSGIFDVSHMGRVAVSGRDANKYVDHLVPTSASSQPFGKSFYTLFLDENAGIIEDLIIVKGGRDNDYLFVINAANAEKDLAHMKKHSDGLDVELHDMTPSSTMIAVQGPDATSVLQPLTPTDLSSLKRFRNVESTVGDGTAIITRTGYTGEDGFEVILRDSGVENNEVALRVWNELASRAMPCGLGARDSLRIEAGLPLYGSDIDDTINPIESDLYWVVSKEKVGYVGYARLAELTGVPPRKIRRGLLLNDGIPRKGFEIRSDDGSSLGEITSGTFSPVLRRGIGMGYIKAEGADFGSSVGVRVRGAVVGARIVKPPFYDEAVFGWKRTSR